MFTAKNINLTTRSGVRILKDNSFELASGEITALIGPNGSGKSSLLASCCGLNPNAEGVVVIDGKKTSLNNVKQYYPKVTAVLQGMFLWPHMTIKRNIEFPLEQNNLQHKLANIITQFNLETLLQKYPHELSGGEKQRVAIARVVALDPKYLFLDEITSALDIKQISFIADTLMKLKSEGKGILLITHHIGLAKKIADKFIFINNGLLLSGHIQELLSKENKELNSFLRYI